MKLISALVLFCSLSFQLNAATDKHIINTGNKQLDTQLLKLNQQNWSSIKLFSRRISNEFMLPINSIENMRKNYEFSPADIFLTAAIADLSGQPINDISRAYIENKKLGWKFTLQQLNILESSKKINQLHKDANLYIH